jgi:hypothetical protein
MGELNKILFWTKDEADARYYNEQIRYSSKTQKINHFNEAVTVRRKVLARGN